MTVVAPGARRRAARRVRRRPRRRRRSSTSTPARRAPRSRWTRRSPPGWPGVPYTAAQVVELLGAVGCDVDAERQPARGHPAVVASRPHRPGRPGRGGRPARRLRRHPLRAADGAARARAHRRAAPPPRRSAGRWPRPGTSRRRPTRSSGRRRWTPWAWPRTTRAARSCWCATRCRRRSRRCGRRCCPACWPRWPATSPAGSATWRCSSTARSSPAAARTPAPLPGVDRPSGRRDAGRAARRGAGAAVARRRGAGRQPRAARLVGARAARRSGPTPCRPPGWSPPRRASS